MLPVVSIVVPASPYVNDMNDVDVPRLEAEKATCEKEQYEIILAFCANVEKAKGSVCNMEDRLKVESAILEREQ